MIVDGPLGPWAGHDDNTPYRKTYVDGVAVSIVAERVEYLDTYGKLVTESLRDFSRKELRKRFASLDEFLTRWKAAERKQAVLEELDREGVPLDALAHDVGVDLDPFDLICHVAYDRPPLTRRERAERVRKRDVFTKYGPQARVVLEALLQKYQDEGVTNLDDPRILQITPFDAMGTPLQLSELSSLTRLLSLHKGIGAKHVNVADMRRALIAVPPTAEQHRIVAKVDELMTVCDRLEAQLTITQTESRRLLEAVLHEALEDRPN